MQEENPVAKNHRQIGEAVIIVVTRRTRKTFGKTLKASFLRDVLKFPVSEIVIERHPSLSAVIRQEQIYLAVPVVIQKTGARSK